jgi:hypothetical protein
VVGDLNDSMADFIVDEIRRARCAAGMTQEAFGKGANCSASLVSAVVRARAPGWPEVSS